MNQCPKCKNPMHETTKEQYMGMGVYKTVPSGEYECEYCIWKGDSGPGELLRAVLGNHPLNPDYNPNFKKEWDQSIVDATTMEKADPVPWDRAKRKIERRACLDAIQGSK